MNSTEAFYAICILTALVCATAGLSKLKRVLKQYGAKVRAGKSAQ